VRQSRRRRGVEGGPREADAGGGGRDGGDVVACGDGVGCWCVVDL
jgi:hypothetical protein